MRFSLVLLHIQFKWHIYVCFRTYLWTVFFHPLKINLCWLRTSICFITKYLYQISKKFLFCFPCTVFPIYFNLTLFISSFLLYCLFSIVFVNWYCLIQCNFKLARNLWYRVLVLTVKPQFPANLCDCNLIFLVPSCKYVQRSWLIFICFDVSPWMQFYKQLGFLLPMELVKL